MDEDFQRHRRLAADLANFVDRKLAGQHHALDAQLLGRAMHSPLVSVICVRGMNGRSGLIARISRTRPRSCTSTASTPASVSRTMCCSTASSSAGKTSVLSVT